MDKFLKFGLISLTTIFIAIFSVVKVKAEDFVEIKPYELNKFEDIYSFADDATPIINCEGECKGYYKVEVKERGILYISNYSDHKSNGMWSGTSTNYHPIGIYLYKSQNMLNTINYTGRWQESLNGSVYIAKYDYVYYLMPGTYYLEVKSLSNTRYKSTNNMIFAGFLADSKMLQIKNIENIEPEKSVVTFSDIGDYSNIYIASGDMLDPEWATSSEWTNVIQNGNVLSDNSFEVTGNGEYTLLVYKKVVPHNNLAATSNWTSIPVMVTFSIDKAEILTKKIKISKTKLTLNKGEKQKLTVKFTPSNVTDQTVTWKSSNKKVATVDKNGKVTAKKKGTCTITAVTSNGKKAKCKITVKK